MSPSPAQDGAPPRSEREASRGEAGPTSVPRVALVQRSIPHYRVALFTKLAADPRCAWTFYCDEHDGRAASGLGAALDGLRTRPISHHRLPGRLVLQTGIPVDPDQHQALVADYGWNIVSNPWLFARARKAGVATIGWTKGVAQAPESKKSTLRRALERRSIGLCDALVVYGEVSRAYFLDLGVAGERIFVAQNTVDTRAIAASRVSARAEGEALAAELGLDRARAVVGFLGTLSRAKRVDAIVAAFGAARAAGADAQLLIAGDGPEAAAIDASIAASPFRADIRRLVDLAPGAEGAFFGAIDLYATFSQAGLGVLEAMAHGVAVLSTPERYPETELLEGGVTGFVSNAPTVGAFGETLARALADAHLRGTVATRAREVALERATLEAMIDAITSAVRFAIARRAPSAS